MFGVHASEFSESVFVFFTGALKNASLNGASTYPANLTSARETLVSDESVCLSVSALFPAPSAKAMVSNPFTGVKWKPVYRLPRE